MWLKKCEEKWDTAMGEEIDGNSGEKRIQTYLGVLHTGTYKHGAA